MGHFLVRMMKRQAESGERREGLEDGEQWFGKECLCCRKGII